MAQHVEKPLKELKNQVISQSKYILSDGDLVAPVFNKELGYPDWGNTWKCENDYFLLHGFNILRLRQNGRHFTDDIFQSIILNEICCILIRISLKYVPEVQIIDMPALVQIFWTNVGLVYWCIYASLGLIALTYWHLNKVASNDFLDNTSNAISWKPLYIYFEIPGSIFK